jgi:hypothetical protein
MIGPVTFVPVLDLLDSLPQTTESGRHHGGDENIIQKYSEATSTVNIFPTPSGREVR